MTNQRKKAGGNLMESAEHARLLARYSATSVLFWDRLAPRTRHWEDISAADHGASDPLLNSATATVPIAEATAPDLVARLDDFFAEAPGGGWVLWSAWPAPILEQHGFTDFGQPPLMIRADHDDPVPVPAGLRIEEATTPAEMAIFDRSIAEWYPVDGYLEDARDPFFSARSLGTTHRYWIGFERDQAVSVAMAVVGSDLVGIFAVATAPSVRGKGYGGVLTDVAARCMPGLPAVLTSSSAGFSVYERIGFRKIGVFHLWLRDRQRR